KIRSRDTHFPLRQDSDFWYLTGFPEPEAVALLVPGRKAAEYILFCREKDAEKETWHGRRAGQEGAIEIHGADDAFPIDGIDGDPAGWMRHGRRVYGTRGGHAELERRVIGWVKRRGEQLRSGAGWPRGFVSLEPFLLALSV